MPNDRLQKLRDKAAQIQARIKDIESRDREQARKNDTRRKIIVGSHALEHMIKNKNSAFFKTLWPLLDEYVTRPQDRDLLNACFREEGITELKAVAASSSGETRRGADRPADTPENETRAGGRRTVAADKQGSRIAAAAASHPPGAAAAPANDAAASGVTGDFAKSTR